MLQSNFRAAVRWITERSGGGVLACSALTEVSHPHNTKSSMSVLNLLHSKHPEPQIPKDCAIPSLDTLPCLEDMEITSAYIQSVAHQLQEGAALEVVIPLIGVIYYFTMEHLVPICVTLFLHCVIAFVIQLYPGMTSEHWWCLV